LKNSMKYIWRAALALLILGCVFVFGLFFLVIMAVFEPMSDQIELGSIVNGET